MRRIEKANPTLRGAQELLDYIRASEFKNIPTFCEAKGLDRLKVQRAITTIERVDVDFAFLIEEATGGAVSAASWRPPKDDDAGSETTHPEAG